MEQEQTGFTEQRILEKIRQLEPQQIAEVVDFIEVLTEKKQKKSPVVQFLNDMTGPGIGLEEVRRRLAKIPGKMSDTVRELRDERG